MRGKGVILSAVIVCAAACASGCGRNQLRTMSDVDRQTALIRQINLTACAEGCYLFLGDSNMELINVQEYFNHPSCNLAVRGYTTESILKEKDKAAALKPKLIVMLVGGNDLLKGTPQARIADNYRSLISFFKSFCDRVYCLSNLPVNNRYEPLPPQLAHLASRLNRLSEDLVSLNANLEAICRETNAVYVDVYSHLLKDGGLNPAYARDPVHLGPLGHDVMMKVLKDSIESR